MNQNGNGGQLDLSLLSGAAVRRYEKVTAKPANLADLMDEIHRLGHTGSLTIHVKRGTSMSVEWEREVTKDRHEGG